MQSLTVLFFLSWPTFLKVWAYPPFYGLLEQKVTIEVAMGPILKHSIRLKESKNTINFFQIISTFFMTEQVLCLPGPINCILSDSTVCPQFYGWVLKFLKHLNQSSKSYHFLQVTLYNSEVLCHLICF